jgi:Zn finger protein HypA/HybF involved in hydrogenase expression
MHEAGLVQGVLEVVLEVAQEVARDQPVDRARVRVGRMHAVEPESFELYWRLFSEDTGASGSTLELVGAPVDELLVEEIEIAGGTVIRNPRLSEPQGEGS